MPDSTPPSDETLREALRLYRDERLSQREIARRMGVSQPTVSEYVKRARQAEQWVTLLDRAEEHAYTADSYRDMESRLLDMFEKFADDPKLQLDIYDRLFKLHKSRRELIGLDAPTRYAISKSADGDNGVAPDPGLLRAVRRMREESARDTALLNAGEPGIIEGGK